MIFWRNFNFQFPVLSEPPPTSLSRIRSQRPLERRFVEEILQKETSSSSSLYLMKARKNTISAQKMCYFEQKMSFHTLLVNMSSRLFFFKMNPAEFFNVFIISPIIQKWKGCQKLVSVPSKIKLLNPNIDIYFGDLRRKFLFFFFFFLNPYLKTDSVNLLIFFSLKGSKTRIHKLCRYVYICRKSNSDESHWTIGRMQEK